VSPLDQNKSATNGDAAELIGNSGLHFAHMLALSAARAHLDGVGEGVADVQSAGDIRRGNHDNKGWLVAVHVGLEEARGLPPVVPARQQVKAKRLEQRGQTVCVGLCAKGRTNPRLTCGAGGEARRANGQASKQEASTAQLCSTRHPASQSARGLPKAAGNINHAHTSPLNLHLHLHLH